MSETVIGSVVHQLQTVLPGNKVTILMYHGIIKDPLMIPKWSFLSASMFSRQVDYLKKYFDIIRLRDVKERLKTDHERHAVVLTFDDGYQNNYDVAFPILRKKEVPATIFLTTGMINTGDTLSLCRLHHAMERTDKRTLQWNNSTFDLSSLNVRAYAISSIKDKLKMMPDTRMQGEINKIIELLGIDPDHIFENGSPFRMLDYESINIMKESGLVDFGAHTQSHTILSRASYDEQRNEIKKSINEVQKLTGRSCELFAYPNGMPGDYNQDSVRILRDMGIKVAVTTSIGMNSAETSLLELNRYGVGSDNSMFTFVLNVSGLKLSIKELLMMN